MLSRFLGSVVDEVADRAEVAVAVGRVVVRLVVEDGVGRLVEVVDAVSLPTGLLAEVPVRDAAEEGVVRFSRAEPATLDLRSRVDEDLSGDRVEAVPAIDMRFAVPEMPRFSSPELAIDRGFSSAELLTEARDRWDEAEDVPRGFRVAVVVVVGGRVGGRFNVLLEVPPRAVDEVAVDLDVVDDEVGRFTVDVPETGRLDAELLAAVDLAGDEGAFSLATSGLDLLTSSLPDKAVESTGVAGGAGSASASEMTGTGSSVDAMLELGSPAGVGRVRERCTVEVLKHENTLAGEKHCLTDADSDIKA